MKPDDIYAVIHKLDVVIISVHPMKELAERKMNKLKDETKVDNYTVVNLQAAIDWMVYKETWREHGY